MCTFKTIAVTRNDRPPVGRVFLIARVWWELRRSRSVKKLRIYDSLILSLAEHSSQLAIVPLASVLNKLGVILLLCIGYRQFKKGVPRD